MCQNLALQLYAGCSQFFESRRDDNGGLHPGINAFADKTRDAARLSNNYGKVDLFGNRTNRRVSLDAHHA